MPRLLRLAVLIGLTATLAACASAPEVSSTSAEITSETAPALGISKDVTAPEVPVVEEPTKEIMAAETTLMVGGVSMSSKKTIVENASAADNLTTLVALVKQAQLIDTLSGSGPFTVFAPTDAAFAVLPSATRESLMLDENREQLQDVLTYHLIGSQLTADDLIFNVERNGGSFETTTVNGQKLRFFVSGNKVKMADGRGYVATVSTADVMQSNGVVHVISSVLIPE